MSSNAPASSHLPNRWVIAVAAFCMQLALGAVYAWSVFLTPVIKAYGAPPKAEANFTFSMALLALGVTAGFGGYLNSRFGPRSIATVAGIIYGIGTILAGFSAPHISVLYLTYGIIGGTGLGLGYIVALDMLIKWFPDRRGFITGLAVAGFGGGAALTGPLAANYLLPPFGLTTTFVVLGIIYLVIVVGAAQFFHKAPAGYAPPGWTPSANKPQEIRSKREYALGESLVSLKWYILWLILALNVTAGAAVISVAAPLAHDFTGVSLGVAALLVTTISIFNGAGRLFWGWISDFLGRPYTFLSLFVIQIILFLLIPSISNFAVLFIPASLVGLCYGGGFGTMPAFAADFFGPKNAGTIYGVMLTAWSAGGIVGPLLIAGMDTRTALYILSGIMLVSCVLPFIARLFARRGAETVEVVAGSGQ